MTEANYSVIRYMPDPGRGESLNVGVLLWDDGDFRLRVDGKAIDRVVTENPALDRDALLYVEPLLRDRVESHGVAAILSDQRSFPIELTEPRFTALDEDGLEQTLDRLTQRIVTPRRRRGGQRKSDFAGLLERRLRPFLAKGLVSRSYAFRASRTGVPRHADFYANSGRNVALDVLRLAITTGDEIRRRADAEAFKVQDVLGADDTVRNYVVLCELLSDATLREAYANARKVIELQGASVVTNVDEAQDVLEEAVTHAG